jgi:branched-chain amino acid aminotransferase
MQDSAERLCIPQIPVDDFVQACKTLVEVEKDWVPHADGTSLYLRPFVFGSDAALGVHASHNYTFCIIASPSGAYYAEGINPVKIYVEDEFIRAAPGLTGFAKCGRQLRRFHQGGQDGRGSRLLRRSFGWMAWRRSMSRKSAA